MNEILEKQVLFFLRNQIETLGYKFVEPNQRPDFLATISVSSKYETLYVPPQTVTFPQWVPGQTIHSYGTYYDWKGNSGSLSSTTYLPGYMTTQTYTRPGYTVGYHFPAVAISLYDGKTRERVWLGTGAGQSNNPDVRVSSQFIVGNMLEKLPYALHPFFPQPKPSDGVIGVRVEICTNDGNNYVPAIVEVTKNSPIEKAGLLKHDMILAVNGASVINKPWSEVMDLLRGTPGSHLRLDVWRTGQKMSVEVTRTSRDQIKLEQDT